MVKTILRRLSPLLIILIFSLLAAILIATGEQPEKKAEQQSLPLVDVRPARLEQVALKLSSYGTVTPKHKTLLVAEVKGRLLSIAPEFVSGGIVRKNQQLAVIEPSDYQADLIQAEASLAQAQAALEEEQARGEVAKIEFQGFETGIPPELGLRKPQLKKEQANVKYAQAAVARAKRNLQRTIIRAPFDAIVHLRNVDLGQYVTLGTQLGELYGTDIAEIRLPISNSELAYLGSAPPKKTQVNLKTNLAGREVQWQGNIVRSEGVIDPQNRMVYLVAEVNDPYQRNSSTKSHNASNLPLKFGTFINADIRGRILNDVVKLPRHLVRSSQVTIISKDNKIELRSVNIVRADVDYVYIKNSIKEGELISYTQVNNLRQGQMVKVRSITPEVKQKNTAPQQLALTK